MDQSSQHSQITGQSILYLGHLYGTAKHRADALERLGHRVLQIDLREFLWRSRLLNSWLHHSGAFGVDSIVRRLLLERLGSMTFDLVWVDGGPLINPRLVMDLKARAGKVVNYMIDDPFGQRDGLKFRHYLRSIPHYHLLVVTRDCNVAEAQAAGAQSVMRVFMSADEVAHRPRTLSAGSVDKWRSDVLFIGTWMPERGPFLARLIELNVPLTIYGDGWQKAKEWPTLRSCWRGPSLSNGDDYAKAIQCAKVCLGLLSKGNRDLCTTRSFEIPCLGGVLCAENTPEHSALYRDGEDAVFWDSSDDCALKCARLLADAELRGRLRKAGRAACLRNRTMNEPVLTSVLETLLPKLSEDEFLSAASLAPGSFLKPQEM